VDLLCRVLTINSKEYTKGGRKAKRYFGLIEDHSGTISFTAWMDLGIARHDIIRIGHAGVRQWQGVLKINIDTRTIVKKITDKNILEKFNSLKSTSPVRKLKINSIKPDLSNISCICRVVSVEPLEIKLNGEVKTVYKGVLADKTGSIRFTAWHDFELQNGTVIEIQNAISKIWRGFMELNLGSNSRVDVGATDSIPPVPDLQIEKEIPIGNLFNQDYLTTPEFVLEGTFIEFKNGSGIIKRCSQCSRAVANEECVVHGKVDVKNDLRLKAVLDDGTGAVTVFIGRELTEWLLKRSMNEYLQKISEGDDPAKINRELLADLIVRDVRVKGDIIRDDFGINVLATKIELLDFDPATIQLRSQELLEAAE
jgi:replication factor A1